MKIFQIVIALLVISFITLLIVKQSARKNKLFKEFVYGRIVSAEKSNKGYYDFTINQNDKLRMLGYRPIKKELMAITGDSIYKESNSNIFFIRKREMPNFIKTDWKDCHISGRWDD